MQVKERHFLCNCFLIPTGCQIKRVLARFWFHNLLMVIIRSGWVIFVRGEPVARLEKLNDLLVSDKSRRYRVLTKFSDYFINRSSGKIVISFSDVLYDSMYSEKLSLNYLPTFQLNMHYRSYDPSGTAHAILEWRAGPVDLSMTWAAPVRRKPSGFALRRLCCKEKN